MLVHPLDQPSVSPLLTTVPVPESSLIQSSSHFQGDDVTGLEDVCDDDIPDLDIATIRAIAALCSGLDFSEDSIPTDVILIVINSITSQAITPGDQALGKFTHRKLKNMDIWDEWVAGERKQLNQFMIYKCLVNLSSVLLKTMLPYSNLLGSTM